MVNGQDSSVFHSPTSVVEETVRVITDRIIQGVFPPGTRLVEEHLAREFGISRPPIRESFRVLEREGLVTISPRRGVRVRMLTADEVRDVYVCRATLRGLAARLAVEHMTPAYLSQLESILIRMEHSAASSNVPDYQQQVAEFNELVVSIGGNHPLEELIRTLTVRARLLSLDALSAPGRIESSLQLHRMVLEAFRIGDGATAERCAKRSLEESIPIVMAHFQAEETE
jgi:DNA-binding GntR family transcriptional regulator